MAYENEAILATQNGEEFDYIIPDTTMLIENPGAVLKDADPKAKQWLDFVLSEKGQTAVRAQGLPPVIDGVEPRRSRAPRPERPVPGAEKLLTVEDDFESWSALSKSSSTRRTGIITKIIAESGKANDRSAARAPRPGRRHAPVGRGGRRLTRPPGWGSGSRCCGSACSC